MARESRDKLERAIELYRTKADYDFHYVLEAYDAQACYDLARACAVMDRREEAVQWLEEAASAGWCDGKFLMKDEALSSVVASGQFELSVLLSASEPRS